MKICLMKSEWFLRKPMWFILTCHGSTSELPCTKFTQGQVSTVELAFTIFKYAMHRIWWRNYDIQTQKQDSGNIRFVHIYASGTVHLHYSLECMTLMLFCLSSSKLWEWSCAKILFLWHLNDILMLCKWYTQKKNSTEIMWQWISEYFIRVCTFPDFQLWNNYKGNISYPSVTCTTLSLYCAHWVSFSLGTHLGTLM